MRRHVVRAFGGVAIIHAVLRQMGEEILQILLHIGIGIFLDQQRGRGVADETGGQAVIALAQKCREMIGDLIKPSPVGGHADAVEGLFHSGFRK